LNADKLDGKEAPLVANVASGGSVSDERNPDVVSSQKLRTGIYTVQFARNVINCHRVAALGAMLDESINPNLFDGVNGEVSTFTPNDPTAGLQPDRIVVATYNSAGTLADKPFHLAVFC
jgi:hypothetical protein